jgi:hypothetical protein
MVIFETPVFTAQIVELLNDEDYTQFQLELCKNTEAGDLIKKTGGLRKINSIFFAVRTHRYTKVEWA